MDARYLAEDILSRFEMTVIANERGTYSNVAGDVRYAGISHSEVLKHYNGEVVYNQEGKENRISQYEIFAYLSRR